MPTTMLLGSLQPGTSPLRYWRPLIGHLPFRHCIAIHSVQSQIRMNHQGGYALLTHQEVQVIDTDRAEFISVCGD
jgi:hypothetical protein